MLSLTSKFFLLYMLSTVSGLILTFIDIKRGNVDKCIINLFNNSKNNLSNLISKEKFFCIYKFVTVFLYLIPIINTIVLFFHLLLDYTENKR